MEFGDGKWYGGCYPAVASYRAARGGSDGLGWPKSSSVDGDSFLGRLRARINLDVDLPTEAQWEYACRAGTSTRYSCGNALSSSYGWCWDLGARYFEPIGTLKPNPFGLYDMHGSVMEWCLDRWGELQYGVDPVGPLEGSLRVVKGGCWRYDASYAYTGWRGSSDPSISSTNGGMYFGVRLTLQTGVR